MANKAYIIANEQQEREVLGKLEREGMTWSIINEKPTENKPSNWFKISIFPYIIFVEKNTITWNFISRLEDEEIVFDGRKEEQMSDKYVVSQEFMNKLEGWKIGYVANSSFLDTDNIGNLPPVVSRWWIYDDITDKERNNRLIAIIRWVNGEDVFEVEKPKKWVVRSKGSSKAGRNLYAKLDISHGVKTTMTFWGKDNATKFDTKEEAESWANAHQEVVEVVDV